MAGYIGKGKAQSLTDVPDVIGHDIAIDRQYSDGDIISLRKDGTTVGSIGVHTNKTLLTSPTGSNTVALGATFGDGNSAGLYMFHSANSIIPFKSSDNSIPDATQSLGHSSYRWKDLYLSGGVYLGGTGSANHLDDYEEGTWTPVLVSTYLNSTWTSTNTSGTYTKIGNLVHVNFGISVQGLSVVGNIGMSGLPFSTTGSNVAGGAREESLSGAFYMCEHISGQLMTTFRRYDNGGLPSGNISINGTLTYEIV